MIDLVVFWGVECIAAAWTGRTYHAIRYHVAGGDHDAVPVVGESAVAGAVALFALVLLLAHHPAGQPVAVVAALLTIAIAADIGHHTPEGT